MTLYSGNFDIYDEYEQFNSQIKDFKNQLKQSVKQEILDELVNLKKENQELKEIKNKLDSIEYEYEEKKRQLEREKKDLVKVVRQERLSDLIKDLEPITYKVVKVFVKGLKCDKCNDCRLIEFYSPNGKKLTEPCECNNGIYKYEVKEHLLVEISSIRFNGEKSSFYYEVKKSWDEEYLNVSNGVMYYPEESSQYAKNTISETKDINYDDLNYISTFFKDYDDAQKFCNYLNNKEVE